jgi:hypothetical protein
LKIEGWQFFQLSGSYRDKSHAEAYPVFAERVEAILQRNVKVYITVVTREKEKEEKPQTS